MITTNQKRPPRTLKERKFTEVYFANGGNGTEAALIAYDCKSSKIPKRTASVIAAQNLARLSFDELFYAVGLDDVTIASQISNIATSATKAALTGNGIVEVPDYRARLEALRLALGVQGKLTSPQKTCSDENHLTVNLVNFSDTKD